MTVQFIMQIPTGELSDIRSAIETVLASCKQGSTTPAAQSTNHTDQPTLEQALDYPPHVRKVVEKYHSQWPVNCSLHGTVMDAKYSCMCINRVQQRFVYARRLIGYKCDSRKQGKQSGFHTLAKKTMIRLLCAATYQELSL